MRTVQPHELFHLDFEQILQEAKRQEEIDRGNIGEFAIVSRLHAFLKYEILPLVISDEWVYEAAGVFASDYANDCFYNLRLTGQEIYQAQKKLIALKDVVIEFLAQAVHAKAASLEGVDKLTKASDFINYVDLNKLDKRVQDLAIKLHDTVKDHEELQVRVVLRGIRDVYEITFTRIMFVVRRALKIQQGNNASKSDGKLLEPANYIDWLKSNTASEHILNQLFVQNRNFYKTSRNVGNHHSGLQWLPQQNTVVLPDRNLSLRIHVDDFHKKYRYLIHFCDLGLRGILAAFCERERGEVSNNLVRDYNRTFPENWTQGEKGLVAFYKALNNSSRD